MVGRAKGSIAWGKWCYGRTVGPTNLGKDYFVARYARCHVMLVAFTRVEASTWHDLREASSQIRERKSRHMCTLLQKCLRVPVPRPCDSPSNGAFVAVAQDQRRYQVPSRPLCGHF